MTATKPTIELRKVSHSKSLSEETPAYTADLYVDGKFFANVSNHGYGGPDNYDPPKGTSPSEFYDSIKALDERIVATYEPVDCSDMYRDGQKHTLEQSLELLCHTILGDIEIEKALKRDLGKKILFQKPNAKGIYQVKRTKTGQDAQLIDIIKKQHGIERTLNEMPFAEALVIYKTAA